MKIQEVQTPAHRRAWLDVVKLIYRDDPNFIRPLDGQLEEIFDPAKNEFFQHGEATRFLLLDDEGRAVGRIAAFINTAKAYTYTTADGAKLPTGGCGFAEFRDSRDEAFMLFDAAREWLAARGMQAMDGPINFGENDNFWGLLVEGFTPPCIGMQYNPPYYKALYEAYGFEFYFEQVTNDLNLRKPFPERFWKIAGWVARKPEVRVEHLDLKQAHRYINDLREIYTEAWEFHENFKPLSEEDVEMKLKDIRPVIIEDFIWFAYYNDEPIAFLIMFPDLNQIIRHFDGKMNLWNKLRFVWYKWRKEITRSRIVIMGVKPKFQKSGIESAIFWHMNEAMKHHPEYSNIELSWVGDFNPKMRALHESVGADFSKRHITYRYMFDRSLHTSRSSIIARDTKEIAVKREHDGQ